MKQISCLLIVFIYLFILKQGISQTIEPTIKDTDFQKTVKGKACNLYTLSNQNGMEVKITNYGGRIVSIVVPDRNGIKENVIIGFTNLNQYINDKLYNGAIIGRFANRIANGQFELDGKKYQVSLNNNKHSIHGGLNGFDSQVWDATKLENELILKYISPDGSEGFPGELTIIVRYILSENNELSFEYTANSNKKTIVNFTNHSYFNLSGKGKSDLRKHKLKILADYTTQINTQLLPTGLFETIANSPFDFNEYHEIGERINNNNEQFKIASRYDHNWVLKNKTGKLALAASVIDSGSGRKLDVFTTEPGLQFYCPDYSCFCLDAQHFPDSPHFPDFPSVELKPKQKYYQLTIYQFSNNN